MDGPLVAQMEVWLVASSDDRANVTICGSQRWTKDQPRERRMTVLEMKMLHIVQICVVCLYVNV